MAVSAMKKKPAGITINLTPRDPFFNTMAGRSLRWALSAGRYIVIFTQLVVIVSFAARFTLDRQLTDLNKRTSEQKAVIESFGTLESDFRTVQAKLEQYSQLQQEENITESFAALSEVTPRDITLESLTITQSGISAEGSTLAQSSFNLFINNLQLSPQFSNINITKVEANEKNQPGFKFAFTAATKEIKVINDTSTNEDSVNLLDRTQGL